MPIDPNEPVARRPRASRSAQTGFPVGGALAVIALIAVGYFGSQMIAADSEPIDPISRCRSYECNRPGGWALRHHPSQCMWCAILPSTGQPFGPCSREEQEDWLYCKGCADYWANGKPNPVDGSTLSPELGLEVVRRPSAPGLIPFSSVPEELPPDITNRPGMKWVNNAPEGLASSSAAFAKARKLAAEGAKHLEDARTADAAGKSEEGRAHRKDAKAAYDTAFTDTAAWEMEILAAYTDKDRQVRDIQRERTKWMDRIIALHKTTGR